MSAVFTPTRAKISLEGFHKMAEAGIFGEDDRIELIDGEMLTMAPIGGPHMAMVNRLNALLVPALGDRGVASVQNPIALPPDSETQPDVVVLTPSSGALSAGVPGPADVLLRIEVFQGPGPSGYARRREAGPGDSVASRALSGMDVEWDRVFA